MPAGHRVPLPMFALAHGAGVSCVAGIRPEDRRTQTAFPVRRKCAWHSGETHAAQAIRLFREHPLWN